MGEPACKIIKSLSKSKDGGDPQGEKKKVDQTNTGGKEEEKKNCPEW